MISTGSRKPWIKKTPAEVVLGEIHKQEERVAEMRKDLAREERELAKLQQAKDIDRVVTLGAPFAMAAVQAVKDAGSSAKVATFDTNALLLNAIQIGTVEWAVDQQPYLQGYLAIDALWLYLSNGNIPGGGQPVLTGPAFVDKTNVTDLIGYAKAGTR